MELTKEQKIQLFEDVLWQYLSEESHSKNKLYQERVDWGEYPGMCGRITKASKRLFGQSVFAFDILEFRATCRKLNITPNYHTLFYPWHDVQSRIKFLEICISIC